MRIFEVKESISRGFAKIRPSVLVKIAFLCQFTVRGPFCWATPIYLFVFFKHFGYKVIDITLKLCAFKSFLFDQGSHLCNYTDNFTEIYRDQCTFIPCTFQYGHSEIT